MVVIRLLLAAVSLPSVVSARVSSTPQALNSTPYNLVPDVGGPTLYYNGSGPVPGYNVTSPVPAPLALASTSEIEDDFYNQIIAVSQDSNFATNCTKCIAATQILHLAALTQPVGTISDLLIRLCNSIPAFQSTIYAATCEAEFLGVGGQGPYYAQLLAKMSLATGDFQAVCSYQFDVCDAPPVVEIDEGQWFAPKPANKTAAPAPSGETFKVLHLSDWHLDPRYDVGSEANCSQYLCCRPYSTNTKLDTVAANASVPASRFGYLYCDSPPDLALSVFSTMPQFVNLSDVTFALFTGDIVSHDNDDQISRAYVEYEERVTYATFKNELGNIPIYPTLGNHDSLPEAYNTPNSFTNGSGSSNIFSWNYELLSSLWQQDGWINASTASYASQHYGAYATTTPQGLKIVSLNTDFWYQANIFNFANYTNPDQSGIFAYLISELEASEQADQRVWIIGHVPSGYGPGNALPNPTALFYSIVRRFSPATIAGVFLGHTHEDQLMIYYDYATSSLSNSSSMRNTTDVDYTAPLTVGYIGPSITPLTGNNAGWQLYTIDSKTFEVVDIQTYFANVSASNTWTTPVWEFEYDTRSVYDPTSAWPATAPLNATFWHQVTEKMLSNMSLVEQYNFLETKSSAVTKNCSSQACAAQKVCNIRSGSAALGALCGSKNGPF
ncbi:MAG: hypothetical protein M1819_003023 [Sarea resinae]|nr:MAG: hypothetical protein M1819_003023 [Sarea resinae]